MDKLTKWKALANRFSSRGSINVGRLATRKALAIGLGSALTFVLVFCLAPIIEVSYTVEELYQATETYYVYEPYTVEQPYTDIETYYEKEPYTEYVPIDYLVTYEEKYRFYGAGGVYIRLDVKNIDSTSGTFTALFEFTLELGLKITESESKYIPAGDTEKLTITYHREGIKSFTYSIIPPEKTVTAYRDVPKTREVIRHKQVTNYRYVSEERTVWKTRPVVRREKVSLLEYLRS